MSSLTIKQGGKFCMRDICIYYLQLLRLCSLQGTFNLKELLDERMKRDKRRRLYVVSYKKNYALNSSKKPPTSSKGNDKLNLLSDNQTTNIFKKIRFSHSRLFVLKVDIRYTYIFNVKTVSKITGMYIVI